MTNNETSPNVIAMMITLVLLGAAGWLISSYLSSPPTLTAEKIRAEVLDTGLPPAETVLEADAVSRECAGEPACAAGALMAYMLLAETHMPGAPEAPEAFGGFQADARINHVVFFASSNTAPSSLATPTDVDLTVETQEYDRISVGRLELFDTSEFDFSADWRIDQANWPGDGRSLSTELLTQVRRAYETYRAQTNWELAEHAHRLERKADAVRRALDIQNDRG